MDLSDNSSILPTSSIKRVEDEHVSESGKNLQNIACSYCDSLILRKNTADFVFDRHETLPVPFQKKAFSLDDFEVEMHKLWWNAGTDMFQFENIGFTHSHNGLKFLICADCEMGPLGFVDPSTKEHFVALKCVSYK